MSKSLLLSKTIALTAALKNIRALNFRLKEKICSSQTKSAVRCFSDVEEKLRRDAYRHQTTRLRILRLRVKLLASQAQSGDDKAIEELNKLKDRINLIEKDLKAKRNELDL